MGKTKAVVPEKRRVSERLAKISNSSAVKPVKKPAAKKAAKPKKAKATENGSAKAEEAKAEAPAE